MVDAKTGTLGQLGIAVAFGLTITTMVYAVGWAAQIAGALAAAALLRASLGDVANVGATLPSGSDGQAFLWEVALTFFLMLAIMAVATDTRAVGEAAALASGGTVALGALAYQLLREVSNSPAPLR